MSNERTERRGTEDAQAGLGLDGGSDAGAVTDEGSDAESEETEGESEPLDPLSLDEALSVVGEETRARIIVALGEA